MYSKKLTVSLTIIAFVAGAGATALWQTANPEHAATAGPPTTATLNQDQLAADNNAANGTENGSDSSAPGLTDNTSAAQDKADIGRAISFAKEHRLGKDTDFHDRLANILNEDHPDYIHVDNLHEFRLDYLTEKYLEEWAKLDSAEAARWAIENLDRSVSNRGLIKSMIAYLGDSPEEAKQYLPLIPDRQDLQDIIEIYNARLISGRYEGDGGNTIENLKKWNENLVDPAVFDASTRAFINASINYNLEDALSPTETLDYLQSVEGRLAPRTAALLAKQITNAELRLLDPPAEIQTLLDSGKGLEGPILDEAVSLWAQGEPEQVSQWADSIKDGAIKDRVGLAFVKSGQGTLDQSYEILNKIQNKNHRAAALANLVGTVMSENSLKKGVAANTVLSSEQIIEESFSSFSDSDKEVVKLLLDN